MVINLKMFLLLSISQFETLIDSLGLTLSQSSNTYLLTYLFANLLAYVIIFVFIGSILWLYRQLFSKKRRSWI